MTHGTCPVKVRLLCKWRRLVLIALLLLCWASYMDDVRKLLFYNDPSFEIRHATSDVKVNPIDLNFKILPKDLCPDSTETYLLIVINSRPGDQGKRKAIRDTWGGHAIKKTWPYRTIEVNVRLAFLFGISESPELNDIVENESAAFSDVIQGTFSDTYPNVTFKTLLGLHFSASYCKTAYIHKGDDDVFVHVPNLLTFLQKQPHVPSGVIYGHRFGRSAVRRGTEEKNSVNLQEYPFEFYPPYMSGASYVVSGHVASKLVAMSEYMPYKPSEDVFVTGCVATAADVERIHCQHVLSYKTVVLGLPPRPCALWNDQIISEHGVSVELTHDIWHGIEMNRQGCFYANLTQAVSAIFILVIVMVVVCSIMQRKGVKRQNITSKT